MDPLFINIGIYTTGYLLVGTILKKLLEKKGDLLTWKIAELTKEPPEKTIQTISDSKSLNFTIKAIIGWPLGILALYLISKSIQKRLDAKR